MQDYFCLLLNSLQLALLILSTNISSLPSNQNFMDCYFLPLDFPRANTSTLEMLQTYHFHLELVVDLKRELPGNEIEFLSTDRRTALIQEQLC